MAKKIFDQNHVAPVRLKRRKTWRLVLLFLLLLIVLFTLSFIISYNMLRGQTSSDSAQIANLQQQVQDQASTIDDLNAQLAAAGISETPTAAPKATADPNATAKPTATAKPAATAKPTAGPTAKPTAKPTAVPTAKPTAAPTAVTTDAVE